MHVLCIRAKYDRELNLQYFRNKMHMNTATKRKHMKRRCEPSMLSLFAKLASKASQLLR